VQGDAFYGRDGFLAKFTALGSRVWATYYGGSSPDEIEAVQTDANGNVFITGWTNSRNGIATRNAFQPAYGSDPNPQHAGDGFLAKFDNDGVLQWGTYYGGSYLDRFFDLTIDSKGNVYAAGIAYSETGIASAGAWQTVFGGGFDDAMIVKFDNSGRRIWASYYGGAKEEYAEAITCDKQNNITIGGMSISQNGISTPGALQPLYGGGPRDGFLAQFTENGKLVWGSYYGGIGEDFIHGLSCDQNDNIIIAGATYSVENIATANVYQPTGPAFVGDWTAYIAKLDKSGNRIWGTYYGYGGLNAGYASAAFTDNRGNIVVCGVTRANRGVASCNAFQQTLGGEQDMFVAMFSESAAAAPAVSISSRQAAPVCAGTPVSFTATAVNAGANPVYQWRVNSIDAGSNDTVFTTGSLQNGDTIVCIVTNIAGCNNFPVISNRVQVAISPSVVPALSIFRGSSSSICSGEPVRFTAVPLNGGIAPVYQWKINGFNAGTNDSVFITTLIADGDIVSCTLKNIYSCNPVTEAVSNAISMTVRAAAYPAINISSSADSICAGQAVIFSATAVNAGNNAGYQWLLNGKPAAAGGSFTTSALLDKDTVWCLLQPGSGACAVTGSILSNKIALKVNPLPVVSIQPASAVVSRGDTVQLSVAGSSDIVQYRWTPAQDISNTTISNPKLWPAITQVYTVEAITARGCIISKSIKVSVVTGIAVPNAFTPNNDGLNDVWKIKGLELYPNCRVSVFNRYGQLVFQSSGYTNPWNGTFRNQLLAPGSYAYIIDLRNGARSITGSLTIIR
jgi:gliding motility-associated-like protein